MRAHPSLAHRTPLAAALLALALFLAPPAARAVDLADPTVQFRMDLGAANGTRACVAFPAEIRNEAECPEVNMPGVADVAALVPADSRNDVRASGAVYFLTGDASHFMIAMSAAHADNVEMSRQEADDLVRGFLDGLLPGRGAHIRPEFDLRTVRGFQVIRHTEPISPAPGAGPEAPDRVLVYHLNGGKGLVHLIFYARANTLSTVQALAESLVQSATMPPPVPKARVIGRAVGRMLAPLFLLGVVVAVVAFVARRSNKSGGPPPPSPPGGPGSPWHGPDGGAPFGAPTGSAPFGAPTGSAPSGTPMGSPGGWPPPPRG